jgi:hypothetical protein
MFMPKMREPNEKWLAWIDSEYPFAKGAETFLLTRLPEKRAAAGSRRELNDLRGISDRSLATFLARLWAYRNGDEAISLQTGEPVVERQLRNIPPMQDYPDNKRAASADYDTDELNPDNF